MSYDPVETLAAFSAEHGISFPLLSDEGSRVIQAIGLENHQIEEHNRHFGVETTARYRGLPYPGTFHLDENGVIVDKRFEANHRFRPSGTVLLEDALAASGRPPVVHDVAEAWGVRVEAGIHTDTYHPKQRYRTRVSLGIADGHHVYVGDVPQGFTTLAVTVSGPASLHAEPVGLPRGSTMQVEGLDETFTVVDGHVELSVAFRIDGEDEGDVVVSIAVALQVCTERECFPPVDLRLALPLQSGGVLRA